MAQLQHREHREVTDIANERLEQLQHRHTLPDLTSLSLPSTSPLPWSSSNPLDPMHQCRTLQKLRVMDLFAGTKTIAFIRQLQPHMSQLKLLHMSWTPPSRSSFTS
jgi:hypothetical protein